MKYIIKQGTIVDGSGNPRYQGDLLIEQDKIKKIGVIEDSDATVIDATGLIVAPGFIDTHSHSDLDVLLHPNVMPKIMQGITTEVLGQDGVSMAPLPLEYVVSWQKNLAGLDGTTDQIDWTYETTSKYLDMIENVKPGLNECYLVPHGNIRMEAMGLDNRFPTDGEILKMCEITRREMQAGAFGLSTGLIYIPCAYSESKELIEMCKVVAEFDGVFVIHQRSEADSIISSMKEVIEIGRQSGVKVHWSHFKVAGKKNWDKLDEVLSLLDEAKKQGIRVSFDQYPYVAGSTMFGAVLPPWVHDGGTQEALKRLADSNLRTRMRYDIEHGIPGWDNFIEFAGFENIYITSVNSQKNQNIVGCSVMEIAHMRGTDPYTATFDLLLEEGNAVGMVDFYGKEEHVIKIMKRPEMNACTDGLLCPGKPHPRLYGAYARILGKYVREGNIMSLEEAITKLTSKPAQAFNMKHRGLLKEGYVADITIFNEQTIIDKGSFVEPIAYPDGIEYVFVNGELTINKGKHTQQRAGKVIRYHLNNDEA